MPIERRKRKWISDRIRVDKDVIDVKGSLNEVRHDRYFEECENCEEMSDREGRDLIRTEKVLKNGSVRINMIESFIAS